MVPKRPAIRLLQTSAALLAAALAGGVPARADGVRWHDGSLGSALAAARQQDKLVLLDAWADWCRYCHVMDEQLWSREDVADRIAATAVPVKVEVDTRRGVGQDIARRYRIESLPVVLLLSPEDRSVLARADGAVDAERLRTLLRAARLVAYPDEEMARLPEDPASRLEVARGLGAHDYDRAAGVAARAAAEADPQCAADVLDDATLLAVAAARSLGRQAGEGELLAQVEAAARRCLDADRARDLWRRALELAPEERRPELLRARAELRPDDVEGVLAWAEWLIDAGRLDRAEAVLERAAERHPEDPGPLAALAAVAERRGELRQALTLVERALELAPFDDALRARRLELSSQLGGR